MARDMRPKIPRELRVRVGRLPFFAACFKAPNAPEGRRVVVVLFATFLIDPNIPRFFKRPPVSLFLNALPPVLLLLTPVSLALIGLVFVLRTMRFIIPPKKRCCLPLPATALPEACLRLRAAAIALRSLKLRAGALRLVGALRVVGIRRVGALRVVGILRVGPRLREGALRFIAAKRLRAANKRALR